MLGLLATALAVVVAGGATSDGARAVPAGFTDTLVANVESPTALAFTPDGRLLVASQFGALRVIEDGVLRPTPVFDLGPSLCSSNEQGLLGVAVDPAFAANGFVYVFYTRDKAGTCVNRVARFTMNASTIDVATEVVLVDEIPATSGNHNGGDVEFGKDGYLYVSVGDGGCDYAGGGCYGQNDAARDLHALVGKILRITSSGGIPASNPFQGSGTARCNVTGTTSPGTTCQETFAWGLRNPFRLAFDPNAAATRFFVNDVGDGAWEEVDEGLAGADYGWNVREGPCANGSYTNCGAPPAGMTNPVHAYSHAESSCHAITGGAFVPNGVWPAAYDGSYLYGDYTCGKIFRLEPNGSGGYDRSEFATDVGAVVNLKFGPSPAGRSLYYTNYDGGGQVRRIDSADTSNRPPVARVTATPTSGSLPLDVVFDGDTSTDPDGDALTFAWAFGDGASAASSSLPTATHTYTTTGPHTATLTVTDGDGASSTATVRIDAGNRAPVATIDTPTVDDRFAVGASITLSGSASDPEDGPLPAGRLSWRVLRHHDDHTHPFLAPTAGNGVAITQPAPENLDSGSDGYLEVQLTATDSTGLSTTVTRNVYPRKVALTFATEPSGKQVIVAGTTFATPVTLTSWEGHAVAVDAPPQSDAGGSWSFRSWSDGGAAAHTIVTPAAATTYTATYAQTPAGLVAAYSFDAGSGTTAVDSSGNGNAGTLSGAAWSQGGRYGSALSFDGSNDWVSVPDSASLDLSGAMTLAAWVRPIRLGGWRTVLVKERASGIVYSLYADQAGGRPAGQVVVGGGEQTADGSAPVAIGVWTHLAATYDGSTVRLYVGGTLAASTAAPGSMAASSGPLRIGGNGIWSEWFDGLIDEVRVYDRALSAAEIQRDLQTPISPPQATDTLPPSTPAGVNAAIAVETVVLEWQSSTDDTGVSHYNVHRSQTSGFTPSAATRIAQPTGTGYTDSGLPAGTYYYRVTAEDAAGNVSGASAELAAAVPADEPPSVAVTSPAPGATASGSVAVAASASDDVGVAGVTFRLGNVDLAAEDVSPPYSVSWDTKSVANGDYELTAVARDTAGKKTTSTPVRLRVENTAGGAGLVVAYGFEDGSGPTVTDRSGRGNHGTRSGASWSSSGRYGSALSFDGSNDWVSVADASSLDLSTGMTVEAWVRPSRLGGWRTVVVKERSGGIVYSLYADQAAGRPVGQVDIGGERSAVGTASVPTGVWTHLAVTFDGAVVRMYVNGSLVASTPFGGSMAPSSGALRIGGNSVWSEWFAGWIDEVRVYERALSAAEIQRDLQTPVG